MSGTPTLRHWQEKAFSEVVSAWREKPDGKPLIAASPGAGKTWLAVVVSQASLRDFDIDLVIVVSPSVNIKEQWLETFKAAGIQAHARADNEALRFRLDSGLDVREDNRAICVTYSQLSRDAELFVEIARRMRVLVIADEVHHADDKESFGRSLEMLAEQAALRLALSGTPFNSSGGALAMCESVQTIDEMGRAIRKAKPTYTYSYGDAIRQSSCRPAEFIKVIGKGVSTYKSLSNNETWQKVIDLAAANRTDTIGPLLDPEGAFFMKMAADALAALEDIKSVDSKAAMLVVAKDKDHGARICSAIESLCAKNDAWSKYSILEVYNDTPKAHERIKQLERDHTDIVVTVRMISEGVDVKRLRVGLYATDYRTRMFFIQFVGRFIRWEDRLDGSQHARVVVPAHPDLILFAREIEKMIDDALIPDEGEGEGSGGKKNEYLGTETEATQDGLIWRGEEESERALARLFFEKCPSMRGVLSETLAIQAAKDMNLGGAEHYTKTEFEEDWGKKNDQLVRAIVRIQKLNGDDDAAAYGKIQRAANKAVGIKRKDKMTPVDVLKKRHAYLLDMLRSLRGGAAWEGVQ
jgi:superfamily II DNA or RNA helicase